MISHFLLNLQDISTVTSSISDLSRPSFVRSDQGQVSSIHFVNSIISSLGMPLRDGPLEDDGEDGDNVVAEVSESLRNDEELHVGTSMLVADIVEENVAGPSKVLASPRAECITTHSKGDKSVEALA